VISLHYYTYLSFSVIDNNNNNNNEYSCQKSFYRSANAIFGKTGPIASEQVTLHLIYSKCIPILLYGLEACPLTKSDLSFLDFVLNRFMIKLFKTANIAVVDCCRVNFGLNLPSVLWSKRDVNLTLSLLLLIITYANRMLNIFLI